MFLKKKLAVPKAKRTLATAEGERCFWVCNGAVLKNLKELRDALKKMADSVFCHHVTKEKNDFAQWVADVLQDAVLATKLRAAKTRPAAQKAIETHLKAFY